MSREGFNNRLERLQEVIACPADPGLFSHATLLALEQQAIAAVWISPAIVSQPQSGLPQSSLTESIPVMHGA